MNSLQEIEAVVNELISQFLNRIKSGERKKFNTLQLEKKVIQNFNNLKQYDEVGGSKRFSLCIQQFMATGILIKPTTAKAINIGSSNLCEWYWLRAAQPAEEWSYNQILEVSDLIDLTFYIKNPKLQTSDVWAKIKCIHKFLQTRHLRVPISREQRSLQIFSGLSPWVETETKEKWLGSETGKVFLKRLNINLNHLVAYTLREPFIYYNNPRSSEVKEVLVLEGLSAYDTCKRMLYENIPWCFGPEPDLIIFGAGFQILGNFEYIIELDCKPSNITVRYVGDVDPEGYKIYTEFKRVYSPYDYNIVQSDSMYEWMLKYGFHAKAPILTEQKINDRQFATFISEIKSEEAIERILMLKIRHERVAQEVFNLEAILESSTVGGD
ncbi:hypothetical protein [Paenibacillus tianmuensis]|uniref:hypothetical protein n=1 Tax=Paenibacillus tianmuensis TaxID=624147 RepID=UPI001C25E9C0|nr:hypothetical protein [Paenibacillus tianmuensis]